MSYNGCFSSWLDSSRGSCPYASLAPGSSVWVTRGCNFFMGKDTGRNESEPICSLVTNIRQAYGYLDMEYFKLRLYHLHQSRYSFVG